MRIRSLVTFRCSGDGLRKAYRASDWHNRSSVNRRYKENVCVIRRTRTTAERQTQLGDYLKKGIELRFALIQELLVNRFKREFAE